MKASFYEQLQEDLVTIRFLYGQGPFDQRKYDTAVASIQEARKKISMHSIPVEKTVLLYCIDTLFEILQEGDGQKIFDFADTVHNIPEVYMRRRDLYSFRREIKAFQKKYGDRYFAFINEVRPFFSKHAPKNKWDYFSPDSDEDFKALHPTGYKWLVGIGITALLLPHILYLIYVIAIRPANGWPLMLGYVGAFTVGIGLFNIVATWIHQYLGHVLTVVCLLGGTALILLSMHLLYA